MLDPEKLLDFWTTATVRKSDAVSREWNALKQSPFRAGDARSRQGPHRQLGRWRDRQQLPAWIGLCVLPRNSDQSGGRLHFSPPHFFGYRKMDATVRVRFKNGGYRAHRLKD